MYNWKDARNYRRFRDENGNVIANIIYIDGEEVAVSDEVYEAYASMDRRERYLTDESDTPQDLSFERCVEDHVPFELLYENGRNHRLHTIKTGRNFFDLFVHINYLS